MSRRAVLSIAVLAAVLVAGWALRGRVQAPDPESAGTTTSIPVATPPGDGWQAYESQAHAFAVRYPEGWTVQPDYEYANLGPGSYVPGVLFKVPASLTAGTNLSSDTGMSVEVLGSGECRAATFLGNVAGRDRVVEPNGREWDVAKGGGAAAGNLYDETVYATAANGRCYGLRLFLHSGNIGNYEPGAVTEFDRAALEAVFAQFRASFATR